MRRGYIEGIETGGEGKVPNQSGLITVLHQKIWHRHGTNLSGNRKRAYDENRKPFKYLVELDRIELTAS